MAVAAGFDVYAHLRLRDHRPGNSAYELPPLFGPGSSSRKYTIASRHTTTPVFVNKVGPGAYDVPSSIGRGRTTHIAPLTSADDDDDARDDGGRRGRAAGDGNGIASSRAPVAELPAQYSMARMPDTPAFSMYGRLKSTLEQSTTPSGVGPGSYNVPSIFDGPHRRAVSQPPPQQLSSSQPVRTNASVTPGPGAYNIKRFGDDVPAPREPPLPLRMTSAVAGATSATRSTTAAAAATTTTPGPGAYDDPTSIASRLQRARQHPRMCVTSTFAGRHDAAATAWVRYGARPGPGSYDVTPGYRLTERHYGHGPAFGKAPQPAAAGAAGRGAQRGKNASTQGSAAPASLITLPSDFDYNYKKGKSMLPRWHDSGSGGKAAAARATVGPGSYNVDEAAAAVAVSPRAVRFAPAPYDAHAAAAAAAAAKASPRRDAAMARGGSGNDDGDDTAKYAAVLPRTRCALLGGQRDLRTHDNRVPGPGHYNVTQDAIDATGRGREGGGVCRAGAFYRGDFHLRGVAATGGDVCDGGGPGAHYNDAASYSRSICGDVAAGKGYTFGVRYPARALYQVCAPRDESTNVNCTYDDERTWESPPIAPVRSM